MSSNYSAGKRQREIDKARKKQDKQEERMANRRRGPARDEIVSADQIQGNLPSIEDAMRAIEMRGTVERSAASIPVRLFVGGLSSDVTQRDLEETFGAIGKVVDTVVMVDRTTREPRGFGFVTMDNRRDASRAIEELHGFQLKGRSLVVNVATDRAR